MLFRIAAPLIVIFWITMTGLLVRREFYPGDASRVVPISHVVKLIFHHQQSSDLQIFSDKLPLGHLRLLPRVERENEHRIVEFSGNLKLRMPGWERQRITWNGSLEMDRLLAWQQLALTVTLRDPVGNRRPAGGAGTGPDDAATVIEVRLDAAAQQVHYEVRRDERVINQGAYALTPEGFQRWLREMELDPTLLAAIHSPAAGAPDFKARQSTLAIHHETIDTYLVTAEQSGQTLFELQISQLGQILQAKTILGYTAAPEDLIP